MFNITMFAANETSIVELETRKNQFCAPLRCVKMPLLLGC